MNCIFNKFKNIKFNYRTFLKYNYSTTSREIMNYDVAIVGAGPSGLSSAIKFKQINPDFNVCVLEKGSEVGSHIISGNVFESKALDELIPNWKNLDALGENPTPALEDHMFFLNSDKSSIKLPIPPSLHNNGNYIISLNNLVRWLGNYAEELGVEIYPGFPADEVLYDSTNTVIGVATKDVGISKDGDKKDTFMEGIEIHAQQTIFAEGARGSCSENVINTLNLRKNSDIQSYGLGIKEVWEIPASQSKPGYIQHTLGWPLDNSTYGGSFLYHMNDNKVLLGFVVGLDYKNPYLSPYQEFQRFKHHPKIIEHIQDGECISYGARVINEGGFQSIPKLTFPGGCLIGCSAGFLNVPKIKGTHTAMKSGMLAAEAISEQLSNNSLESDYQQRIENSWIWSELYKVRNFAPSFKWGLYGGMAYSGISSWVLKGREPWTLSKHNGKTDSEFTSLAINSKPIEYPKPDGKISFDLLTNLQRSGTDHNHDQPSHLKIKPNLKHIPTDISIKEYDGPEQRFCPAKVYEYEHNPDTQKKELKINSQNCIHCKCCSIKMPYEYINWTVPEGGGGPNYNFM